MMIIGCDFHTRYQQIAMMDEGSGELVERRLDQSEDGGLRSLCNPPASSAAKMIIEKTAFVMVHRYTP